MLDFWAVYERLLAEAQQTSIEAALRLPGQIPVSEANQAELRAHSRAAVAFLRSAIHDGDWEPYRAQLRLLGARYAELGVSFESWFRAMRMFQRRLIPALVEAYNATPLRLAEALIVTAELTELITELVSERYFEVRQEDRFRLLVDSIKDYAIYIIDPTGVILTWNAGAAEIKGYAAEEVIGRSFEMFFLEADRERGRPAQLLAIASQAGRVEETARRLRKDGSEMWADVVITALRGDANRLVGFAKVVRDLTERKQFEAALEARTRELEHANSEIEAFSYSVAHDLRAPLRAMSGHSEALLEDWAGQLDAEATRYLVKIQAAAKRMSTLIDGLLDLSRLTRGELQLEPVDLSAVARAVTVQLAAIEPERAIAVHVADGLRARVEPRLVRTLFDNLIGNAWKFTRKTAAPRIEVGTLDAGHTFFVRDNGAGFDLARASKLFVPFERLHSDTDFPGTGIGLATVQRIVQRHGGRIWASAEPGHGASFFFTLAPA
ncbi:MAG TPA: PAS domain S-box protein [Kofleriaceae bacterium]|nr:PAS domain S-box protein [Kofleriaceae bacterium]